MNLMNSKFDITAFSSYKTVFGQYTDEYIKNNRCVKVEETETKVIIAVSAGYFDNLELLKTLHAPKTIEIKKIKDSDFVEFIGSNVERQKISAAHKIKQEKIYSLENISNEAPVVNIINSIWLEAIRKNASDIHIQCDKNNIKVRFRIDGVLQTVKTLDKSLFNSLVSRIKVLSGMNVMENRLCQDGRLTVNTEGKSLDFRVSIVPSTKGQSVVLRLFNYGNKCLELEQLGITGENYKYLEKALNFPSGLVLATGPTGSGKSTTLHAMLSKMDYESLKIVTIEDPVEKEIDGIDQIQVNDEIGLSFGNILRRILRQDPDVIMVGEIRDKETAELAVRAALTGHLILSTLHTNDSISSITRLKNLGIEPYLIASVLRLCLAQRLVRKVCTDCNGNGCESCNYSGYKGRTVISEIFSIDEDVVKFIEENRNDTEIRHWMIKNRNFKTLKDDAMEKIRNKITTESEAKREGLL